MTRSFVSGLRLSEAFYNEIVRPILDAECPGLAYAAGLIGPGSEVLGYDDAMSTDHDWGPRLLLFINEPDHHQIAESLHGILVDCLPAEFRGYPTNFSDPDAADNGTQRMVAAKNGPINHRVTVQTTHDFFHSYLGVDLNSPLTPADWLTIPENSLCSVTSGAIFHDAVGLEAIRDRLAYYPRDIWLYLLGCGWARIGQEEHLMGRAGIRGDEIGSALIGARLVRDIMRLCFLMQRSYAPYAKWFGRAFQELACAPNYTAHLQGALRAEDWESRQGHLIQAYEALARLHNSLGLTAPMPETVTSFFDRPFEVIAFHGFADALFAEISDPHVRQIAARAPIGSIDQFSDSTDLLSNGSWQPLLRRLYEDRQTMN